MKMRAIHALFIARPGLRLPLRDLPQDLDAPWRDRKPDALYSVLSGPGVQG
jgi:hypothetical protein